MSGLFQSPDKRQSIMGKAYNNRNYGFRFCLITICFVSCQKLVEIPSPANLIAENNVYTKDATAIAVLTGIYTNMSKPGGPGGFCGAYSISVFTGLASDELALYNGVSLNNFKAYYKNGLSANSPSSGSEHWTPIYNYIYKCNAAIEGLNASNSLTPAVKKQLLGEAKFMRAFFYFYLVNLYGDVPLIVTTDYKVNSLLSRTSRIQVYQQMINDLKDAQGLLSEGYLDGTLISNTNDRVRPSKWAAASLLARVYLFNGNLTGDAANFSNAEEQATAVINNKTLYDTVTINNVFFKNSKEAIWQLQPVTTGRNTEDGWTFVIPNTGPNSPNGTSGHPVYLTNGLMNNFELGDQRNMIGNWIGGVTVNGINYYFPYKYKSATLNAPVTEYFMVLRLAEQYLIRAEARAQQNKIIEAQSDVNVIRKRAGLSNTIANDKSSLLVAILHERQVELFSEWGHRWFDLKRTGNIDQVMNIVNTQKGGSGWQSYQQLYPIPLGDIQKDVNLTQNPGY